MTRAWLSAGVAAVTATALTVVPSADAPSPSPSARVAAPPVLLTAAAEPLAVTELPDLLGDWLHRVVLAPTAAAPSPPPGEPIVGATSLGNAVLNAWNWALPWIDYGVELADYVLGFIPGGYLIGDQIDIVYFSLVRPVANSFVVDLVAPVLNEPLNPASYVNGLVTLGQVTVNSLINLGINEFNYFFGWLIPPIPPLPPLGTLAVESPEAELTMAASVEESPDAKVTEVHSAEPSASEEMTSGAVAAQGEVRDSDTPGSEEKSDEETDEETDEESEQETQEESDEVTDEAEEAEDDAPADADADETTPASSTDDDASSTDTDSGTDAGDTSAD